MKNLFPILALLLLVGCTQDTVLKCTSISDKDPSNIKLEMKKKYGYSIEISVNGNYSGSIRRGVDYGSFLSWSWQGHAYYLSDTGFLQLFLIDTSSDSSDRVWSNYGFHSLDPVEEYECIKFEPLF